MPYVVNPHEKDSQLDGLLDLLMDTKTREGEGEGGECLLAT